MKKHFATSISFGEVGHDRWLIQPRHDDERSESDLWTGGVMWRSG